MSEYKCREFMPIYHYECRESSERFPNLDTRWRSRLVKISHRRGKNTRQGFWINVNYLLGLLNGLLFARDHVKAIARFHHITLNNVSCLNVLFYANYKEL